MLEFEEFAPFPKITRYLNVNCVITEKIDGTNAALAFDALGEMRVQSRSRVITPQDDNYGFAAWATENQDELFEFFGPGRHFGEWWGRGVQKRYGQHTIQKWFSPFNVGLFNDATPGWPSDCTWIPILGECELRDLDDTLLAIMNGMWSETESRYRSAKIHTATAEGLMIWSSALGYIKHPFDDGHKWTREAK